MEIPKEKHFSALRDWGMIEDPLAAVHDYSDEKAELRWENSYHKNAHEAYKERRQKWGSEGFYEYYKSKQSRPIDRTKWEFLKLRKSWYICPLGWGNFASPETSRILDLGCGDGDVTQRIADYIGGAWKRVGYDGFPMEITGVDLNKVRVQNAEKLCRSPHDNITISFEQGDAIAGLDFEDNYFDYVVIPSVLEILPDQKASDFLDEATRLASKGIYIFDMLDEYPGGYPREDLTEWLSERSFSTSKRMKVFQQPFTENGSSDPMEVWPITVGQVIFAEAIEKRRPSDRFTDE